jgi:putative heme iron utilization protein
MYVQNMVIWRMDCLNGFYNSQENSIVVNGHIVKENTDKIALKMGIEFKCSNEWLQHCKE